MSAPASSHRDHDIRLLAWLAVCVSVFSFLFYFRRGEVLLYGDAIAHINIARRIFDSKTPGLLQLGTVWLPLPHLLMVPFLISNSLWRSGLGGSIPSMAAYVLGVVGIFRLVRGALISREGNNGEATGAARIAAWTAALIYGANPNLIYIQATAMGEPLYLAFFIWVLVYFGEFVRGYAKALTKCGLCLMGACLTRYDGWFLAMALVVGAVVTSFRRAPQLNDGAPRWTSPSRNAILKFVLLAAIGPALWLAYNAAVYRNPLEFANGPYSAKAIERKTATVNPARGNLLAAGAYFLKSAQLNVAEPLWLGRLWLALAVAGGIALLFTAKGAWPLLLLWLPLPFYAWSLAYGGVPIFVPTWWPFSYYNVRYGLELLPAFAAGLGALAALPLKAYRSAEHPPQRFRLGAAMAMLSVAVAGYGSIWHADPICYREAAINMRRHLSLDQQVAHWLQALPPDATLLMFLGEHVGALQQAGIPLKRVINEGNHRTWKQPSDPEGLWERALANPPGFADYAVAFEGDPVWQATQVRQMKELVEIKVTGQPRAILYRAR